MAKADQLKRLIASYGRPDEFRAVATQIIEDAHRKGHIPLAASLKRTLDSNVRGYNSTPSGSSLSPPGSLISTAHLTDPALELVDAIEPKRRLDDIVLAPDARASFDRLFEEHSRADELRRHHLPIRSKILLCGPPGCGKTMSAEVIARELDLPLLTAKVDVLISSLLGQTAANLRRLFDYASRRPCVLFLDEFDALARSRTDNGEHNELRRVVNSLLGMIDKFKNRSVLIAATNLDSSLDDAIWRRFDDVIHFSTPNTQDISRHLHLLFKNYPINFEIETVVSKLNGLSYADIERLTQDAIKTSILKKRKSVAETDFAAALKADGRRTSHQHRGRSKRA